MREILFRVWDGDSYMSSEFTLFDIVSRKILFTSDCEIMQFTGLLDKNGKKIFEGDIISVKSIYADEPSIHEARYHGNSGYPAFELYPNLNVDMNGFSYLVNGDEHFEVIGNVHENKELLK